jgi:UDP:flavonoid glycosyltransferase YjiC (YdhE family)
VIGEAVAMLMKRIVFCTFGSLGDIYPLLALARELRLRGHWPVIATTPAYRRLIQSSNIGFHPVRPDFDPTDPEILSRVMDRRTGGRYIVCNILLPALREAYEDTAAVAEDADLLVIHPMALSAFLFARKAGAPWASVALAPMSLYSIYDPPVVAGVPFAELLAARGPAVQRHLLKGMAMLFEPLWKPFRRFERDLGLPPAPNPLFWGQSPHLTLGLFSRVLAEPQRDWPVSARATGFPFFDQGQGNSPELQRFLDAGEPPIVFTLGSAAVGVAGDFFQQSAEAAYQLGRRAVLLVGRDPANHPTRPLPQDVIAVPHAPHAAVFPRAGLIVHQGGIGTTAEAMRAGRPMLVVPYSHDQPDNAARLTRLGIARSVPRERYDAAMAAREIRTLLWDPAYANRAVEVGLRVRSEAGTSTACDLMERLLSQTGDLTAAFTAGILAH